MRAWIAENYLITPFLNDTKKSLIIKLFFVLFVIIL